MFIIIEITVFIILTTLLVVEIYLTFHAKTLMPAVRLDLRPYLIGIMFAFWAQLLEYIIKGIKRATKKKADR